MQFVSAYIETPASPKEAVVAFVDGVMNQAVFQVTNISDYRNCPYPSGDIVINADSVCGSYYLDGHNLWMHQSNARVWTLDTTNKYFYKSHNTTSATGSYMLVPTRRLYGYKTLKFTARMSTDGSGYFYVGVGASAIVDGHTQLRWETMRSGTYQEISVDISGLPYIDYLWLCGCDGFAYIKEIKLE